MLVFDTINNTDTHLTERGGYKPTTPDTTHKRTIVRWGVKDPSPKKAFISC